MARVFRLLVLAAACAAVLPGGNGMTTTPKADPVPRAPALAMPRSSPEPVLRSATVTDPVELRIPSIGVRTSLERLHLGKGGTLDQPRDPGRAGWFAQGIRPGEPGPAVVAGHVDSRSGPGVFARLRALRPGAAVTVIDADGTPVTFSVDVVRSYAKDGFPTHEVYGATPDPQLRLITCGGAFNRTTRHYESNVVVYGSLREGGVR
jgi:hypothetical protein